MSCSPAVWKVDTAEVRFTSFDAVAADPFQLPLGKMHCLVQLQRRRRACPCQHSYFCRNSSTFFSMKRWTLCLSLDQVVNDEFLGHVRNKQCEYVRGDIQRLTRDGVLVNVRSRDSRPGDKDIVVMAAGFERPDLRFLEDAELFPEGYEVYSLGLPASVQH